MCAAVAAVDILIREHWLTEPNYELAVVSSAVERLWIPLHRLLLGAAIREYLSVQHDREVRWREEDEEDTSLWDALVAEWPENFDD